MSGPECGTCHVEYADGSEGERCTEYRSGVSDDSIARGGRNIHCGGTVSYAATAERIERERDEALAEVSRLREDDERLRHALRLIRDGSQHAASIALVALKPESHSSQSAEKAQRLDSKGGV